VTSGSRVFSVYALKMITPQRMRCRQARFQGITRPSRPCWLCEGPHGGCSLGFDPLTSINHPSPRIRKDGRNSKVVQSHTRLRYTTLRYLEAYPMCLPFPLSLLTLTIQVDHYHQNLLSLAFQSAGMISSYNHQPSVSPNNHHQMCHQIIFRCTTKSPSEKHSGDPARAPSPIKAR
jgi:hypothetical protein